MGRIVGRVRALAMALGGPGLFLVAFLDSTFLPLPGATDLLLIIMITRHKEFVAWYILAAITGSLSGCLVMHAIGKKGGEASHGGGNQGGNQGGSNRGGGGGGGNQGGNRGGGGGGGRGGNR